MSDKPQHIMDREGLIWRVVRDGGMATRADFSGVTSIGIEELRRTRWPLTDVEAALDAGSDTDDDMCPNCVTPWKCNGPHERSAAPAPLDVETLAEALKQHTIKRGSFHDDGPGCMTECASDIIARLSEGIDR